LVKYLFDKKILTKLIQKENGLAFNARILNSLTAFSPFSIESFRLLLQNPKFAVKYPLLQFCLLFLAAAGHLSLSKFYKRIFKII